jgi:hypothetical protein
MYEAKRRPAIADAIARIADMSEEDIRAVPVPLPWVTIELLAMWKEKASERAAARADQMMSTGAIAITYHDNEGCEGNLVRWTNDDTYLAFGRSLIEVRTDKLLWLPDEGGYWFGTSFGPQVPAQVAALPVIGRTNRRGYTTMYKDELARANPIPDSIIDLTPKDDTPRGRLAGLGVRIG